MSGDMLASVYDKTDIEMDVFGGGVRIRLTSDIPSTSVAAPVEYIQTLGYSTVGVGPAVFRRSATEPPHAYKAQSLDGAWWVVVGDTVDPFMIGAVGDGVTVETAEIQATFDALAYFRTAKFPNCSFRIDCGVHIANTGKIEFDDTTFLINDSGPDTTLRDGVTKGKVGIYFDGCVGLDLSGTVSLIGQGVVGATRLCGVLFEKCHQIRDRSVLYCENMAAGRFLMWCDYAVVGDMLAYRMKGFQTFDSPLATAGSAEVVVGCQHSKFGGISSRENYKPILYLSPAYDENGTAYTNSGCFFGWVTGTAAPGSSESSLVSVRSAYGCHFDGASGTGFSLGFYFVKYASDAEFVVDQNSVESLKGDFVSTAASAEAALQTYVEAGASQIGSLYVGSIQAKCAAEFGILIQAGRVTIGSADIEGGQRPFYFTDCVVRIHSASCRGQVQQAVAIGDGADVAIGDLHIRSGAPTVVTGAVSYSASFGGSGGKSNVSIQKIIYGRGGAANDYLYVFYDGSNSFETTQIGHVVGSGSSGVARFGSDTFDAIRRDIYFSIQAPTTQTYRRGSGVANSAPVAGGTTGWVCVASGTPGTWKAEASLAT